MTALLMLAALGCTDDVTTVPDSSAGSTATDSGGTSAAQDSGLADTADSGVLDSGSDPDDDPSEPDPGVLAVSPRELVVDPGATWTLRVVHHLDDRTSDVAPLWESSDPGVVTVDADGVATAVAPGAASLSAWVGELGVVSAVTVQSSPVLRVQLVAAETGRPVSDGAVIFGGETLSVDPATGVVQLPVADGGDTLWFTGFNDADDRIPATVLGVVGRQVVLPLRTRGQLDPDSEIDGTFDFSNLPPLSDDEKANGWVVLGIAGGSLRLGPLFWRAEEVLSPNRDVELYGLQVSVPGNLAIHEYFEDWLAPAWSGDAGVWSMAGPVPLAEAILGLSTLDAALDFLLSNMDGFVYDYDPGLVVPADAALELEVAPVTSLSDQVQVVLPDWPEGFSIDNPATLVALDGAGVEGPTVVGFGRGFAGDNNLARVPGSFFGWDGEHNQVLAYLEAGGLGTLGAKSLRVADVVDGVATIGPLQDAPAIHEWNEDDLLLDVTVDGDADFVFIYVSNKRKEERDYYLPTPTGPVSMPLDGPEMNLGTLTFEVSAVETSAGTFDGLVSEGRFMREALVPIARSTSFVSTSIKVDSTRD